jgi:hypothetical protein
MQKRPAASWNNLFSVTAAPRTKHVCGLKSVSLPPNETRIGITRARESSDYDLFWSQLTERFWCPPQISPLRQIRLSMAAWRLLWCNFIKFFTTAVAGINFCRRAETQSWCLGCEMFFYNFGKHGMVCCLISQNYQKGNVDFHLHSHIRPTAVDSYTIFLDN